MILALIPARGGSKGIPRKNARAFLGRPLVAWAVDAALASGICDRVVVSTDDEELAAISREAGAEVPFLRPPELAGDEVGTAAVAHHALDALVWDAEQVLVLEPTSPARRPVHVRDAALLLARPQVDSVASVSAVPHHHVPSKVLRLSESGTLEGADGTPIAEMIHRRQDLETLYAFNGIVFGCRVELLHRDPPTLWGGRVAAHVVDPRYAIDLDRPEDWAPAEARVRELDRT